MLSTNRHVVMTTAFALSFGVASAQSPLPTDVNQRLGLRTSETVQLIVDGQPGKQLRVAVPVAGQWVMMKLDRHSVRGPNFKLMAPDRKGKMQRLDPGPVMTMRGEVLGSKGSRVAAAMLDNGLHARILLANGDDYWLQPVDPVNRLVNKHYVIYRDQDIIRGKHRCGAGLLTGRNTLPIAPGGPTTSAASNIAELGIDADFEYYQDYGSSTTNVANRIQSVINTVNLQYENQVDLEHQIAQILVRTSSNQPYTSTDAVTLLNQFRNEWNANQGGVQRDVAHLFTGKEINSSTIGIAWIGAICTSYGYGLSQSDFNNNFGSATDLTAHELGHNWNAQHCSCPTFTMNPSITSANNFSSGTISTIVSFRNSRTCLSTNQTNQAPSCSAGPNRTISFGNSASLDGTVTDDGLPNPPGVTTASWSRVSGPGTVTFANASAVDTTASFSAAGTYVLRLTANDGALTSTDDMTVTVQSAGGTEQRIAFDDINSGTASGGTGWASSWTGSGNIVITGAQGPHTSPYHLRSRRTGLAQRTVNLSGVSNATLSCWIKLRSFENSDRAEIRVSSNGGQSWTVLRTFVNGEDSNTYRRYQFNLNSSSSNTVIQFRGLMSSNADYYYIDDVEIRGVR